MRRHQLHLAVFFSSAAPRLAHFPSAFTPQTPTTHSSHHPSKSLSRAALLCTLRPLPQLQTRIYYADSDQVFRFLKKFSSLVTHISQNPRNFVALRRLDFELGNVVERLDCASLVFAVKGLCKIRKLQRAKDLLIEMRRRFVDVSELFWYGLVFDCLVRDGGIDEVEIVWNDVCGNDTEVDVSSYTVYVCRFGDLSGVTRVCKRVLEDGKVLRGRSYGALIGALCRYRDEGSLAKEVVLAMDRAGVRADDLSYYAMYRCYCGNGNLDDADWILRRLVKRGFKMDVYVHGSFLYGLCKSGKVREANKLFRKLIRKGGVEKSSGADLRLGRRAIFQLDFAEDVSNMMMAYETYFRSLCSVGRLDDAHNLFKETMKMRTVPQTCVHACFIKALFKAGRDSDALKFYDLEKKKQHICTDEIVGSVVKGLSEIGRGNDGLEMLNEAISKGGFYGVTSICNDILSSFWKGNKIVEAEVLFERMNGGAYGFPDASTYSIMIRGLCHQGDVMKALSLFGKMLERKLSVSRVLYEEVINELSSKGQHREALELLNSMLENGHAVSFNDWDLVFHSFMNTKCSRFLHSTL